MTMWSSPKYFTVHPAIHFNHAWITLNSFASVDHSRVKLTLTTSKNDTDYINANFIKVCQQRTCTAAYLLHYFLPLAYNNLKCASVQTTIFWWFRHEVVFLSSGSIGFKDVYCHTRSSSPHRSGLPEDDLGVRDKGTRPQTFEDTAKCYSASSIFHNMHLFA